MKRVKWEIDLEEDTAEAAAVVALAIQRDTESTANVFDVTDEDGKTVRIDLQKGRDLRPLLRCDDCGRRYVSEDELARVYPDIPDLFSRIGPGGTVPSGECPLCGALVYPDTTRPRIGIILDGGLVRCIVSDVNGVQAAVLDTELQDADEFTTKLRFLGETWEGVVQREKPETNRCFIDEIFDSVRRDEARDRRRS